MLSFQPDRILTQQINVSKWFGVEWRTTHLSVYGWMHITNVQIRLDR